MIVLQNVGKKFNEKSWALQNIDFTVSQGGLIGVIGPDGAGKTTFLRILAGLLDPTTGTVNVDVQSLGYMPQRFGLYEDLSVLENLTLYADLRSAPHDFEELLSFSGLEDFTQRLAGQLSGGMKQKLGLACALIQKPQLLLLDEPTVGVDPLSRRELWDMIQKLLDGKRTILWSTAYLDEAQKCDQVFILHEGKSIFFGTPQKLMEGHASFEDAFITALGGEKTPPAIPVEHMTQVVQYPIVADKLTKTFGHFVAANAISFQVKKGEIFGLLGPNGAGKSTTFKMLCGLTRPTSGSSKVNDIDLQKNLSAARLHIGYMAQKFSLYSTLTVIQNLKFFGSLYSVEESLCKKRIQQMVDIFDLGPFLEQTCDVLPIGFKQRLSFAAATLHSPQVLFLDEPTSGMDPLSRRIFWKQIQMLASHGCTIMVTTHFLDEAEYCDRIALLYKSEIIYLGDHQALKDHVTSPSLPNPTLDDAFVAFIQERKS